MGRIVSSLERINLLASHSRVPRKVVLRSSILTFRVVELAIGVGM